MSEIKLSKNEMERMVSKIKTYFSDELDQDIGAFDAEFLVEFVVNEIGPYIYNQGLNDAHTLFSEKAEETTYLVQELEKPTTY